jgi:hypothetical protein
MVSAICLDSENRQESTTELLSRLPPRPRRSRRSSSPLYLLNVLVVGLIVDSRDSPKSLWIEDLDSDSPHILGR